MVWLGHLTREVVPKMTYIALKHTTLLYFNLYLEEWQTLLVGTTVFCRRLCQILWAGSQNFVARCRKLSKLRSSPWPAVAVLTVSSFSYWRLALCEGTVSSDINIILIFLLKTVTKLMYECQNLSDWWADNECLLNMCHSYWHASTQTVAESFGRKSVKVKQN